jgi:hypothetical protein
MCFIENEKTQSDLSCVEHVLLWSIRAWVIGLNRHIPVDEAIEKACAKIGAPAAATQLYGFMWALADRASRSLDVRCVCNKRISSDEHELLLALALAQQGRSRDLARLVQRLVAAPGAAAVIDSAHRVAGALTAAGQFLPRAAGSTELATQVAGDWDGNPVTLH